ncbi:hypothetical protein FSP39_007221, partial [Pinctada imbricata]
DIPNGQQGMYAVHLSAFDKAGNWKTGRKVFLFDDIAEVEIVDQPGKVTRVVTASQETNYLWVVEDTTVVKVQWTDRFRNARHEVGRWLNQIKAPSFMTDSRYDDNSGNRTINEINNVHAIVDFKVSYDVYDVNGVKDTRGLMSVSDIQNQYDILNLNWADGDKMYTVVRAIDVLGKYNEENQTVYRDASPPVIEDLWLTRGERLNVSVHRIEDFKEMTIEWIAYDLHSGIDSIYWRLFDNYTGNEILHGHEDILAQGDAPDLSTCQSTYGSYPRGANCYCTAFWGCYHQHFQVKPEIKTIQNVSSGLVVGKDQGVHDSDYYIEVSVTSKAKLTTILSKKITIDSSPPHTGIVNDGMRGTDEVDYQQDKTLYAHWDGFFDRESGILFYQYGFSTACIPKATFELDNPSSGLTETYSLHATHTVTTEGKYFITVVAYNRALEPSDPVCSDGVTVDTTVPAVEEVTIEGARIKGGLITDSSSSAYYVVGENRVRRLIPNPTSECISKATQIADIDMLPQEKYTNGSLIEVDGGVFCLNTSSAPASLDPMLAKSSMMYIEWNPVNSPGGVHNYEVGLSSTANSAAPDILAFKSTKQHAFIRIMHGDVPDGTMFYIIIKTVSKASVEGLQTIGPCFMDTTPPDFTGPITVTYNNGYILASWAASAFVDAQDSYPLDMQFAIGHDQGSTDVHSYQILQSVGPCTQATPPTCTAIKVEDTDWRLHGHHTYYITVKAENSAGLTTYGISSAYVHDVQLPTLGVVFEVVPDTYYITITAVADSGNVKVTSDGVTVVEENYVLSGIVINDGEPCNMTGKRCDNRKDCEEDIDYQSSTTELKAYWSIPDNMKYYTRDIHFAIEEKTPLTALWNTYRDYEHISTHHKAAVTDLNLSPGKSYRFKIKICAISTCYSTLTSDGVTILPSSPITGQITIEHLNLTQGAGTEQIIINMERFYDPDVAEPSSKYTVIEKYEWAITDQSTDGRTHTKWTKVTGIQLTQSNTWMTFTVDLPGEFDFTKCRRFSVRGNNMAKLVASVSSEIKDCAAFNPILVKPNHVIDTVGVPSSIGNEFYNFKFDKGTLTHGERYLVCLHGDRTEIQHEKWLQILPDLNTCSDGVVVDLTPPTAGDVWITNIPGTQYQTSTSDMYINWHSFRDVEELNTLPHSSGIQDYELGIGTSVGGNDVVAFYSVGVVNHAALHGLMLQSGHTYYATIIAKDFANRTTTKTSDPVIVDITPPVKSDVFISISGRHIVSKSEIEACWKNVFTDVESGIDYYEWGIGSEPGYDDIMAFAKVTEECGENDKTSPLDLKDGHAYFISVKAYNKAGLMSLATSWAFVVDTTPPIGGHVYDGKSTNPVTRKDVDFQTDMSTLDVYWEGFHDPHTPIKEYFISVGTCPQCENVLGNQAVGIVYELSLSHIHFGAGLTYYTTITACNTADLCTSMTSDGVIMDNSPPSMGIVYDGTMSHDIEYQSLQTYIGAKWYGFADAQSGLAKYEWRAGTSAGSDDILSARETHLTLVASLANISPNIPTGTRIYITVRAYNRAGQWSEASSDGFIVDTSAPEITNGPVFKSGGGNDLGIYGNIYLTLRTSVKVYWTVNDGQSSIERQFLSLRSHVGGDFNLASTSVRMFAIETDHAAELERHVSGWMTWSTNAVYLAWLGFADIHSEIDFYFVNIGKTYMASDLNKESGKRFQHTTTGVDKYDEGKVQTFEVPTERMDPSIKSLFITAGLSSALIHSEFEKNPSGALFLVRRCEAVTCEGHCVCSPQDKLCSHSGATCNDISSSNTNNLLSVHDSKDTIFTDADYTFTNSFLAGSWKIVHRQGTAPKWYQWSVGYTTAAQPEGIFDQALERVWHDAGQNYNHVFSTLPGVTLTETETYSFFLKVWYEDNTYAIFKSNGVTIATLPPSPTNIRGSSVNERMLGSSIKDQDHIKYGFPFVIDWQNKFLNADKSIARFRVYLSTFPGGKDIYDANKDLPGSQYTNEVKRSTLKPGTKYYSNVIAYGLSGIHHTESSDGFTPDKVKPMAGIVYDGVGLHDFEYQNSSTVVGARWHGFTDTGSGIVSYEWCVGFTDAVSECGVRDWENVGVHVSASRTLSSPLSQNNKIYNKVYAKDSVGYQSTVAVSDGAIVDMTPPEPNYLFHEGTNKLTNPSFEQSTNEVMIDDATDTTMNLTVGSVDITTGIFLDHLTFEVVERSTDSSKGQRVSAHVVSLHEWGSIHGSWGFIEDVSHIREYTWAIGYTPGGTQLQGFESVGKSNFAYNSSVVLVHNSSIYVTVVASNTAGLQNVAYSTPILVDLTGPSFSGVYDGRIIGEDKDEWSIDEVSVNWEVEDPESGIDFCEWAIGYQQDGIELQSFQTIPPGVNVVYKDVSYSFLYQKTIYTTIRCHNKAGLITSSSSDGVKISNEAPSSNNSVVRPIPLSITEYQARENFQSNTSEIRMTWSGFYDHIGIKQYQMKVQGNDINYFESMKFPTSQDVMYANIQELDTVADRKTTSITAENDLSIISDPVLANLTIFVEKPSKLANQQLQVQWNTNSLEFTVSWNGVFSSPHPLYYEVSAGKVRGGGEIVQWLETNATSVTFGLPPAITDWAKLNVYMFVRAIAAGGLYDDIHGYIKLP